jgi:tetratricopeptide (TPR) repeat protein/tRNA A-37 threonylcarbamoyl transferase component Bud32
VDTDEEPTRVDTGAAKPTASGSGLGQPIPARIGRFRILGKLGEGGMSVVYDAFDPKVERHVALKLLRSAVRHDKNSQGEARLLREAQTIGRLSHPNVVQVFEVGEVGDDLFLAMEFVAGENLRQWLAARPRRWREVVAVFLQAGAGLAAAHAAGVVHRDFKPDNAIVGDDGRVRVLDFGLARPQHSDDDPLPTGPTPAPGKITITHAGAYIGTPAYMSPEQHLRQRADAKSDQFAFCVALYEALWGVRPFPGRTAAEVRLAVFRPLPTPPRSRRVPARLRRIVARGLSVDSDARYPDMPALLADLAQDPARAWRRVALAAGLALAGAGVAAYFQIGGGVRCTHGADALAGVWDDARRTAARAAFLRTGVAYAAETWPKVQAELDAYATGWAAQRDEACAATHVRGEASAELLDLRNRCLDARLQAMDALVDALVTADAATVERALQGATGLAPLAACASEEFVRARVVPPADPSVSVEVERARELLVRAAALRDAGRPREAREIAAAVRRTSEPLAYPPLQAEVLLELGRAEETTADYALAEEHLLQAYHLALAIGHDAVATDAAIVLTLVLHRRGDFAAAFAWSEHARSLVARTGHQPEQETIHLLYRSYALTRLQRHPEAVAAAERGLAIAESRFRASDPRIGRLIAGLAHANWTDWDSERALELFRRSRDVYSATLGHDHPFVAASAINVSTILYSRYDYAGALAEVRPALAIMERAYGPDHPNVADALTNIGSLTFDMGRAGEALAAYERAAAILARRLGPADPRSLNNLVGLGNAQRVLGRLDDALGTTRRLLALQERRDPRDPVAVAKARLAVADVLADLRRRDEAEAEYAAALAVAEGLGDAPSHLHALTGLARVARERGDPVAAETLARRTLALDLPKGDLARQPAQLELAEALLAQGRPLDAIGVCQPLLFELERRLGPDSYAGVGPLVCLGRAFLARAQHTAAIEDLQRALAILDAADVRPSDRADVRVVLAEALRDRDPLARAAQLAAAAVDYRRAGPLFAGDAARLTRLADEAIGPGPG